MMELTDTQARVLAYIVKCQDENQRPPTHAEIARHFEWASPNGSRDVCIALERKGYIRLTPNVSRGIFVLQTAR